jgi:hypothetical protein
MHSEDTFSSRNLFIGETARKGIVISRDTGTLSITSATYMVYDGTDNSVITSETDASYNGSEVWANISAGTTEGLRFAIFKFVDGNNVGKARLDYEIVKA